MNIIGFVVSFVLFFGGIWLFGSADAFPGYELVVFIGGVVISSIGFAIPIHIMKRVDG